MIEAVRLVDEAIDSSDRPWALDEELFESHLNESRAAVMDHLDEQRGFARQCFVEIGQVLGESNAFALKDIQEARWTISINLLSKTSKSPAS